jgi:LAO/AO transport system kinase
MKDEILKGDRRALAKAITLVESTKAEDQTEAHQLIQDLLPHTGKSLRIGISGTPGVGKSTLIETLGMNYLKQGKRVAVLAVDPSSSKNRGSILGDKSRMTKLSQQQNAFIRPSPAGGHLGGVARKTRESILLCEAAGFDTIIVETVGVGQSETLVSTMVDAYLVLQLPHSGDEIQGIKKGILELADVIAVTKADGDYVVAAKKTKNELVKASMFFQNRDYWQTPVVLCSATQDGGLKELEEAIHKFIIFQNQNSHFTKRRKDQDLSWFDFTLEEIIRHKICALPAFKQKVDGERAQVRDAGRSPVLAASEIAANLTLGFKQ